MLILKTTCDHYTKKALIRVYCAVESMKEISLKMPKETEDHIVFEMYQSSKSWLPRIKDVNMLQIVTDHK